VAMVPGDFGALIPAQGAWVSPQVVIVPLLAFDARGFRLGYGGAFTTAPCKAYATGGLLSQ